MLHITSNVDCCNPTERLNKIVAELRPQWPKKCLISEKFHGGLVNTVFSCRLEDDTDSLDAFVVKVFPDVDIKRYIGNSLAESRLVCQGAEKVGCGPSALASFGNGIVYKYVRGHSLSRKMMRDEHIMRKSTILLAKFHTEQVNDIHETDNRIFQREHFVEKLRNLFDFIPEEVDENELKRCTSEINKENFEKSHLIEEFQSMEKLLDDLHLKVILSHGDFHCKNIIYDEATDSLKLIDYDLTSFNYEAYDLSHLLFEQTYTAPFGLKEEDDPGDYDDDVMRIWISYYLKAKAEVTGQKVESVQRTQVEMMLLECKMINTLAHLMVVMYSLANWNNPFLNFVSLSTAKFAYENYQRDKKALPEILKEYKALKSQTSKS